MVTSCLLKTVLKDVPIVTCAKQLYKPHDITNAITIYDNEITPWSYLNFIYCYSRL